MNLNFNWTEWRVPEWVIVAVVMLCVMATVRGCFVG